MKVEYWRPLAALVLLACFVLGAALLVQNVTEKNPYVPEIPIVGGSGQDLVEGPVHRVREGETLSSISRSLYGDSKFWPEIAALNGIDPNSISAGMVLHLPREPTVPQRVAERPTPVVAVPRPSLALAPQREPTPAVTSAPSSVRLRSRALRDPTAPRAWDEPKSLAEDELQDTAVLLQGASTGAVTEEQSAEPDEDGLLAEVRRLGGGEDWNGVLELLDDERRMRVARIYDLPKYLYWRARANRNLYEQSDWNYEPNGKLTSPSKSSTYLERALSSYGQLVQAYPDSYLADDAQGWVGGCLYRQGEYTQAAYAYVDQLEWYPRGDDTLEYGTNSLYWAVRGALRFWESTSMQERDDMVALLSIPKVFSYLGESKGFFLPRFWGRLNRSELDRLFGSLRESGMMEQFLLRSGGQFQALYSLPLVEVQAHDLSQRRAFESRFQVSAHRTHLYAPFLEFLFYTGEFQTCFDLLESMDPLLDKVERDRFDAYHYLSAAMCLGAPEALRVAIRLERLGGVIGIAYDFAEIEDLIRLAGDPSIRRMYQDLLRYVAALRLIAHERFDEGREQLLELLQSSPQGLYRDRCIWRLGELSYFLRCDQLPIYSSGTKNRAATPFDESDRSPGLEALAKFAFGSAFLERNAEELPRLYRRFRDTEGLAWARRESRIGSILFRVEVAGRVARVVEDLRSLPGFDDVPAGTKSLLDGIVRACMKTESTPHARFQFEEAILREVLAMLVQETNPFGSEEYENLMRPCLGILWRFANAGRYADNVESLANYQTFQRAQYLHHNESLYRDLRIPVEAWDRTAYQYVYYLGERHDPPLYRGVPYRQARQLYETIVDAPVFGETAAVRALECEKLVSILKNAERWNWLSVPREMARQLLAPTAMVEFPFSSDPRSAPIDPSMNGVRGESLRRVLAGLDDRVWAVDFDETAWVLEQLGFRVPFAGKIYPDLEGLALRLEKFVEEHPRSAHVASANLLRSQAYASLGYEERANALLAKQGKGPLKSFLRSGPGSAIDRLTAEGATLSVVGLNRLLVQDCDGAFEIGEGLRDHEDSRVREAAGYLRGLAALRSGRLDAGALEFLDLVEKLPEGDRSPWYLDLLLRCIRGGGSLASSDVERLERVFDTEAPFNNTHFVGVALREVLLRSGDQAGAEDVWNVMVQAEYPTRDPRLFRHPVVGAFEIDFPPALLNGPVVGQFAYYFFDGRLVGPISIKGR